MAGPNLDESDLQNEPLDIEFVASALLEPGSPVRGLVDPSRIALAGHSDGGEAALDASWQNGAPGTVTFQALLAMSVRPLETTLAPRNPPLLVTQGDQDAIDSPSLGEQAFADAAPPKYLTIIHGGGHLDPLTGASPWLPGLEQESVAFWRYYLSDQGSPAAIVEAGTAPGLSTTSQEP